MACHETFNQHLKNLKCLSTKFRHGINNHKIAFEAVCAILQYELDNDSMSLFHPYLKIGGQVVLVALVVVRVVDTWL
jgi:hypothetical protein